MTVIEITPSIPATTPRPVRKPHTPLAAVRSAGRATGTPGRRPAKPITFDSAL